MFIVDRDNKRTFDPDTGFELKIIKRYREGPWNFSLTLNEKVIIFSASFKQELSPGHPTIVFWKIEWISIPLSIETDFAKNLVVSAMSAYKQINGLPETSNVVVDYDGCRVRVVS